LLVIYIDIHKNTTQKCVSQISRQRTSLCLCARDVETMEKQMQENPCNEFVVKMHGETNFFAGSDMFAE